MRIALIPLAALAAGPALAHPGHVAEAAGHNHWIAGAAIGLAVLAGLYGWAKGRRREDRIESEADEAEGEGADA